MNAPLKFTLHLAAILLFAVTANSAPTSIVDDGLANLAIPGYVKELYRNLSKQDSENTDATTIRSIPAMYNGENNRCGFNFSISEVSDYEIFRRAELRIHMKQPSGDLINTLYLQLYHGRQRGSYKKLSPIREGWVVFDVLNEVNQWRDANHPHKKIHFYIIVYSNEDDLIKGKNGRDCSNSLIQFDQPIEGDDNQPLLMIYSHDLNVARINITALAEATNNTQNSTTGRHRRQTVNNGANLPPLRQSCGKHSLVISLDTLNEIWRLTGRANEHAIFPRSFNINVCAGECSRSIPLSTAQHSIIAYFLHTRNRDDEILYRNATWGQCCAPVKYRSIETLFSLPRNEVRIVTIKDMSVEQCSCLTILERTPVDSQRR
jgi:hypothetical protein